MKSFMLLALYEVGELHGHGSARREVEADLIETETAVAESFATDVVQPAQ